MLRSVDGFGFERFAMSSILTHRDSWIKLDSPQKST
jgi:hypothetical protein